MHQIMLISLLFFTSFDHFHFHGFLNPNKWFYWKAVIVTARMKITAHTPPILVLSQVIDMMPCCHTGLVSSSLTSMTSFGAIASLALTRTDHFHWGQVAVKQGFLCLFFSASFDFCFVWSEVTLTCLRFPLRRCLCEQTSSNLVSLDMCLLPSFGKTWAQNASNLSSEQIVSSQYEAMGLIIWCTAMYYHIFNSLRLSNWDMFSEVEWTTHRLPDALSPLPLRADSSLCVEIT